MCNPILRKPAASWLVTMRNSLYVRELTPLSGCFGFTVSAIQLTEEAATMNPPTGHFRQRQDLARKHRLRRARNLVLRRVVNLGPDALPFSQLTTRFGADLNGRNR
jgi:hypothetical protein